MSQKSFEHTIDVFVQLASNYTSFFLKLVDLIETLGANMAKFNEVVTLLYRAETPSPRFKAAVSSIYGVLLDFFREVTVLFLKKDGRKFPPSLTLVYTISPLLASCEANASLCSVPLLHEN
jgi:hypothetical protein